MIGYNKLALCFDIMLQNIHKLFSYYKIRNTEIIPIIYTKRYIKNTIQIKSVLYNYFNFERLFFLIAVYIIKNNDFLLHLNNTYLSRRGKVSSRIYNLKKLLYKGIP